MSAAGRAVETAEQTAAEVEAAEKFIADLIARGEAVEVDRKRDATEEPLPPGATHEIHRDDKGEPVVRRRRYSAF
ncbi:hypothetical protein [Cryptosporangium aurantiacum]|uniref:Uncharacterized protein n=1 Tax=Cryptosporangium aurantiacum TaxID=134849 RepID=A0A1M7QEG2_9ACTN|nr:hypothetical protein [Cryptosporangium aurantiacum]SHN28900.1 hypothetical protein SAMN05443668_104508 [Cryptosporangium aurantiacum]